MIESVSELNSLCASLQNSKFIAIDTEFKRVDTFLPVLCLIQISDGQNISIIDPIKIKDLSALKKLITNTQICWVFHSARQDLEVLYQYFGVLPKKIFDTQIAANFINFNYQISYQDLLKNVLDVVIEKKYTRIDWSKRPLPIGAIEYAADDVRYLLNLKNLLEKELVKEKKIDWVNEDFESILNLTLYQRDIFDGWKKVKGFSGINNNKYKYAFAISAWREQRAIKRDKPRKWIMSDEKIYSLISGNYSLSRSNQKDFEIFCERFKNEINNFKFDKTLTKLSKSESEQKKQLQSSLVSVANKYNLKPEVLFNKKSIINFIKTRQKANFQSGWRYSLLKEELSKWETF